MNSSSSSSTNSDSGLQPQPVFTQKDPKALKPHPQNTSIYGEEDVSELVELIRASGWLKPLVVTTGGTIISGHRRWKAVMALGWESVLVEVREFPSEIAELQALLLENANRFKTVEQRVREADAWISVETAVAHERQIATQNNHAGRAVRENFPQLLLQKGRASDRLAKIVGLGSGRTYQKAAKVVVHSDEEAKLGHQEVAQVLRQTLNEQSVDGAYGLLKKSTQELTQIANLITSGKAKSPRQAVKMINQNNDAAKKSEDALDPSQPSEAGFSVGDWVEINSSAHAHNKTYIGQRGRIEQILAAEKLFSVSVEDGTTKARFDPCELSLLVRAVPAHPVRIGDIVFVRIDRHEAASPLELKWNGFWGQVTQVGKMGSLSVDVGLSSLQLFPRDLKPVDAPSAELRQVVERVRKLRQLEIDEFESGMLDMLQRREWFTSRHLHYLDVMEKLINADSRQN